MTLITDKAKNIKNRLELIQYCRDTLYSRINSVRYLEHSVVASMINDEFTGVNCTIRDLQILEDPTIEEEELDRRLHYKTITGEGEPQIE